MISNILNRVNTMSTQDTEELIHNLITERINMFHDALVERGQIKPLRPQQTAEECPLIAVE